jgi:hypothetical protein
LPAAAAAAVDLLNFLQQAEVLEVMGELAVEEKVERLEQIHLQLELLELQIQVEAVVEVVHQQMVMQIITQLFQLVEQADLELLELDIQEVR